MTEQKYTHVDGLYAYEKLTFPTAAGCVVLTRVQFDHLLEYSTSNPSGAYANKVWKRRIFTSGGTWHSLAPSQRPDDTWMLCEYVEIPDKPTHLATATWYILLDSDLSALAEALFWFLPT